MDQSGRADDADLGAMTANGATTRDVALAVDEPSATKPSHRLPDFASWPPARRNLWLLVGVAVCCAVVELLIIGLRYEYTTDEAIYLSQLNPLVPNYGWAAWRAWGIPVLAAPVAVTDAPLAIVRLYFVLLSNAGLVLAFRPWLALSKRPLVPIAAAIFASTAVVVYTGSLALPNGYSALAAIAATGYFMACRRGADGNRRSVVGLAAAVGLAALVRPSDSLWLVLPLGLVWLALHAWRRRAILVAIVVGQIVGWAPWVIESFARFNGPLSRLRLSAASLGGTHVYPDLSLVRVYVRLWSSGDEAAVSLDVPRKLRGGAVTIATHHLSAISVVATIWWIAATAAIILAILGAVLARWDKEGIGRLVLIPLLVGLSVGFPYLFMMRYAQLRFLLPAVGLIALPVAYGVLQLGSLRIPPLRALGPTVAVALLLPLVGIQVANAPQYDTAASRAYAFDSSIVQQLRDEGVSHPCAVGGDASFAVAYQAGCESLHTIRLASVEPASVTSARSRGDSVAIVMKTAPPAGTFLDQWRSIVVHIPGSTKYGHIYLAPR